MRWKELAYFTRTERRGVITLIALCALVVAALCFIPPREGPTTADETFVGEYEAFIDSLHQHHQKREAENISRRPAQQVILSAFDPNTIDSAGFVRLGLAPWMAKSILHYRSKGGKFSRPEEFKKVHGLTEAHYATLLPYISIAEASSRKETVRLYSPQEKRDSLAMFKYPPGTVVALNHADTTELKKIPGIGSSLARTIVDYRKQLGGF